MVNSGDQKSSKSENSSSPTPPDRTNVHVYPDWAAMQAYYGGRVPLPPYYNSAVAAGHAPHPYMWGPTPHMMPPYGPPYAAIYSHRGVYTHPGVPLAETALSIETPAKSSGSTDRKKKSKRLNGLEMSIGKGSVGSKEEATDHDLSQSTETEVSSGGSDGNMKGTGQTRRKRSLEGAHTAEKHRKAVPTAKAAAALETNPASGDISPSSGTVQKVESALSPSMGTSLELMSPSSMNTKTNVVGALQTSAMMLSDGWVGQNESDLKRERRKQSNRESARRSRLRKQAETEELAIKVDSLNAENLTLKSEVHQLTENSMKLKLENAMLMEKLKLVRQVQTEGMLSNKANNKKIQPLSTKNLLARVNNSSSVLVNHEDEEKMYETNSKSNTKLRQLMDTKPMANAVAAI